MNKIKTEIKDKLSKCCEVPVIVATSKKGGIGSTFWHECTFCFQPCDLKGWDIDG